MRFADLFAGIGGFRLGLERAGMRCAWACEIDEWTRQRYAERFGREPEYRDIKGIQTPQEVDLLAGGFPCQDISIAGKKAGLAGRQSGLWSEYLRLIVLIRPRWVIVENVKMLRKLGLAEILTDLAACGYDAEWDCLDARAFGVPQRRERIFIVAYPRCQAPPEIFSDATRPRQLEAPRQKNSLKRDGLYGPSVATLRANVRRSWPRGCDTLIADTDPRRVGGRYGFPQGMDSRRYIAIGNAVVPQVVEWIGRRIMHADREGGEG